MGLPLPYRARFLLLMPLLVLITIGCSASESELERTIVTGQVTFQGEPVVDGVLRFVPIEGTKGPPAAALIQNGAYSVTALGGVPVGKVRVEIRAFRTENGKNQVPLDEIAIRGKARQQYLPANYNWNSELMATIKRGREQVQDFELR